MGLQVAAAVYNCPVIERLKEIAISQDPFKLEDDASRRLAESADPATRTAWLRMVAAKRQALEAARDNATAEAFKVFLRRQHADLRALCARDILEFVSSASIVSVLLQNAATDCGRKRPKYFNARCGKNVAQAINRFSRAGRFASQMEVRCPERSGKFDTGPQPSVTFGCGDRLEGVAWSISAVGRDINRAAYRCSHPHDDRAWDLLDIGACVTEIAGAVAYVGSTGLSLAAASQDDCVNMTADDLDLAARVLDGQEELHKVSVEEAKLRRLACARDIISSTRTLGLAANRATRAASSCGGRSTACGQDVAFTATALAAVAEAMVLAVTKCRRPLNATASDERKRRIECTRMMGSSLKELSVVAAQAINAAASCRNSTAAVGPCGSGISAALASLGYLLERTALAARNCPPSAAEARFSCGTNMGQDGQALTVASMAVATAAVNCGLGLAKRASGPFSLPRRFWVPG